MLNHQYCLFDDQDFSNSQSQQLGGLFSSFPSNTLPYYGLCTHTQNQQLMRSTFTTTTPSNSYPVLFDSAAAAAPVPPSLSESANILKHEQDIFGGNLWAWGDLSESIMSSKRNGSTMGISAAIKKKKKMKGRRKVREPRFCFKTLSDVDVLDDGYKWRKYGQKVVKNTQHPRSYYRCTQDKCRVKKRIERLAEDPRMVITTYEGRHIHSPSNDDNEDDSPSSSHLNTFFCI